MLKHLARTLFISLMLVAGAFVRLNNITRYSKCLYLVRNAVFILSFLYLYRYYICPELNIISVLRREYGRFTQLAHGAGSDRVQARAGVS